MGRILEPEVMASQDDVTAYDELDRRFGDILFEGFAESACRMGVREGRVLDVGTGPGWIPIRLAALNERFLITGVDMSENMLRRARENADRRGVGGRIRLVMSDAKRLPFPDASFDLVLCHNMLHQLPEPADALREIVRVARPDGAILVRDVRRLPGPAMEAVLPLYCLGYSAGLRRLTVDSFRAGLSYRQLRELADSVGLTRARLRAHFITHIAIERPASKPERPAAVPRRGSLLTRLLRWPYLSRL